MFRHKGWVFAVIFFSLLSSCSNKRQELSPKNSPHEKYRKKLAGAGLDQTKLGKLWIAAASKSLSQPDSISLPYKETGYFEMENPTAAGYLFSARQGELVKIEVTTKPTTDFILFTELWEPAGNENPKLLAINDTATNRIEYEVRKDGRYIVRLQPELLQSSNYTITVTINPSLAFPVNKKDDPQVKSFWGAVRDGGSRSHEGIDIFAKKRTPAIAVADGRIARTGENNLGGKVVFLRPEGKDYRLYYAHLDTQWVSGGDHVKLGDTVGLIGNTGNARTTPAHLHFGVYTNSGTVDPFPFVNTNRPLVKDINADTRRLSNYARIKTKTVLLAEPSAGSSKRISLNEGSIVKVVAAVGNFYKVKLPDEQEGYVIDELVSDEPLNQKAFTAKVSLLDMPDENAAIKTKIDAGKQLSLLGTFGDFYFAKWNNKSGWIKK